MRLEDLSENDGSIPLAFVKPSEIIAEMACSCTCSCRDLFPRQTRRVSRIIVF